MAKKALIAKAKREPKFKVRKYNRCPICGRSNEVTDNGMDGYYCYECAFTFLLDDSESYYTSLNYNYENFSIEDED